MNPTDITLTWNGSQWDCSTAGPQSRAKSPQGNGCEDPEEIQSTPQEDFAEERRRQIDHSKKSRPLNGVMN
jgi:hypothetical protein